MSFKDLFDGATRASALANKSAKEIWDNEVESKEDLLGNAIAECIKLDEERGVEPN